VRAALPGPEIIRGQASLLQKQERGLPAIGRTAVIIGAATLFMKERQ